MKEVRPNFFIIGAPRCGTTAMSTYLSEHPLICFSEPKEPLFFCTDMPGLQSVQNESEYLSRCFGNYQPEHTAIGEGSVWYLSSKTAIANILDFDPSAKFILMVRNPIDMLVSLHQKMYLFLDENEPDFSVAWSLQARRREGDLPTSCREPKIIQYDEVGMLGSQVQRAFSLIPKAQRHVVVFDHFMSDSLATYKDVISFLDLPYDGREVFPKINENQRVRSRFLLEQAWHPPELLMKLVHRTKRALGINRRLYFLKKARDRLAVPATHPELSLEMRRELTDYFSSDIDLLGELIGRDLEHWKTR